MKVVKAPAREHSGPIYEFGPHRMDVARRRLTRDGEAVPLFPRSFDALALLIEHRGKLLDKEFLLRTLWPDAPVEDNSLARAISDIRRALGEGPKEQRYVATVPRVGYRFVADVRIVPDGRAPASGPAHERPADVRSLAVLPFASIGAADEDYLGLGLTDALIARLSALRTLVVRPTSSVLRYASDAAPAAAGRALGVDAVVSGSVRRLGSRVRVSVQLLSTRRETALWAERFEIESDDVFAIEDSISDRIAATLALELTRRERELLARQRTADAEAYRRFLKGRYFWTKRTEASLLSAIECYEQALEREPGFALAWAGISDCYVTLSLFSAIPGGLDPSATLPKARDAALRALALDDSLAEAHASLAHALLFHDWDWPASERSFRHAIALDPSYPFAHHWYAMALGIVARHEEALAEIRRARELDPLSLIVNGNLAYLLYRARRYDEAVAEGENAVAMDPTFPVNRYRLGLAYQAKGLHDRAIAEFEAMRPSASDPLGWTALAHAYAVIGRTREAEALLETLLALRGERYVSAVFLAEIEAGLGRTERALDWLERAMDERPTILLSLRVNPKFDRLRAEPRFREIERRIGIWG